MCTASHVCRKTGINTLEYRSFPSTTRDLSPFKKAITETNAHFSLMIYFMVTYYAHGLEITNLGSVGSTPFQTYCQGYFRSHSINCKVDLARSKAANSWYSLTPQLLNAAEVTSRSSHICLRPAHVTTQLSKVIKEISRRLQPRNVFMVVQVRAACVDISVQFSTQTLPLFPAAGQSIPDRHFWTCYKQAYISCFFMCKNILFCWKLSILQAIIQMMLAKGINFCNPPCKI